MSAPRSLNPMNRAITLVVMVYVIATLRARVVVALPRLDRVVPMLRVNLWQPGAFSARALLGLVAMLVLLAAVSRTQAHGNFPAEKSGIKEYPHKTATAAL